MLLRSSRYIPPAFAEVTTQLQATSTLVIAFSARFFRTGFTMGGDCCGGDEGVQAQTVEDINGVSKSTTTKTHADFLAERQPFYEKRINLFEEYWKRQQQELEAAKTADEKIKVVLPDGNEKEAVKGATTPMDIAKGISSGLAKKVVVASVDGQEWDINRPLTQDCALQLFSPADPEGQDVRSPDSTHHA